MKYFNQNAFGDYILLVTNEHDANMLETAITLGLNELKTRNESVHRQIVDDFKKNSPNLNSDKE